MKLYFYFLLLFYFSLHAQTPEQVIKVTKSVADKIIRETNFDFINSVQLQNYHWNQLRINEIGENNVYVAKSILHSDVDTNTLLGFGFTGNISVFLNNEKIFEGLSDKLQLSEYAYRRFKIQEVLKVKLNKGENLLVILCKSYDDLTNILFMPTDKFGEKLSNVNFVPLVKQPFESRWLKSGPYSKDNGLDKLLSIANENRSESIKLKIKPWEVPSLPVISKLRIDKSYSYTKDTYAEWQYSHGGTMLGILNVNSVTKDDKYLKFVTAFADNIRNNMDHSKWQYYSIPSFRGSLYRLFRMTMLDDSGGPVLPFIELKLRNSITDYDTIIEIVENQVLNTQERIIDGTICRAENDENTIWADDLFMSVPFLCRLGKVTNDHKYFDEAAFQILQFNKYLLEPNSGLYFHGFYHTRNKPANFHWGRANGWMTWAMSEALLLLPEDHENYDKIVKLFANHIKSVTKYQNSNGMWNQLLDMPETYDETSCTAMFTLALARGVINGWIDEKYESSALLGWQAITNMIEEDGNLKGVCTGTGIRTSVEEYQSRPTFDHDPRGLGAVLTAGSEIYKMLKR